MASNDRTLKIQEKEVGRSTPGSERNENFMRLAEEYPHGFFSSFVEPLLQSGPVDRVNEIIQIVYQSCPVDEAVFDLLEVEVTDPTIFELVAQAFLIILERDMKLIYLEWCISHIRVLAIKLVKDQSSDASVSLVVSTFFGRIIEKATPLTQSIRCLLVATALSQLENSSKGLERTALSVLDELIPDPFYLERCLCTRLSKSGRIIKGCYLLDEEMVTLKSMCIYMNHTSRSGRIFLYTPAYRFITGLQYLNPLLDSRQEEDIIRAFEILENILPPEGQLSKSELAPCVKSVIIELLHILVFNDEAKVRKQTLRVLEAFLNAYHSSALYILLLQLRVHVTHSGTLAFLVSKIKTSFMQPVNLTGKKLGDLLELYCLWKCDEKDNVIDQADHIIASLNVLWYLLVVNKRTPLQVDGFFDSLRMQFIPKLTKLIDKTLQECHRDLNEIGAGIANAMPEVPIQIPAPALTDAQKIESVLSVRNAAELIKINVQRIVDFFETNR